MSDFVHFRVHSDFSLGRGASKVEALFKRAAELGMPALALTDHEALHGAMQVGKYGEKTGVQPIVGAKMFMPLSAKSTGKGSVIGVAQSEEGYANLCRLLQMELRRDRPRAGTIDGDMVKGMYRAVQDNLPTGTEGVALIAGTGADGLFGRMLAETGKEVTGRFMDYLARIFVDRFFVEVCRNGHETQEQIDAEAVVIGLAKELGHPLIATSEVWYATPDRHDAFNVLAAVMEGRRSSLKGGDDGMDPCGPRRFHMRSGDEMHRIFRDVPEAVENTLALAVRCPFWPSARKPILPPFRTDAGRSEEDELRFQAREGLRGRLERIAPTPEMRKVYEDRLEYELGVISDMKFPGYFLIVSDFIKWAKEHDIPVGPGRGSGAGSLVAYALLVTDIDPLPFGLLFERFLNPERVSMPDFDIDFCETRRGEVIDYVQKRYGADRVGKIISFAELKPRGALKDVARVLTHVTAGEISSDELETLTSLIPKAKQGKEPTMEEVRAVPEIGRMIASNDRVRYVFGKMEEVSGIYRNSGLHAAGIVIGGEELSRLVPMGYDEKTGVSMTQFNMKDAEAAGLVKFDFLGLKTLSIIRLAVDYVKRFEGRDLDLSTVPYDDMPTLSLFRDARTIGLFQFESDGMRNALGDVRADTLDDLIAVTSLFRPGPMEMIPEYAACKNGRKPPDYPEPVDLTAPFLKDTFGVMVYQEQIMQVAQSVAGMSLGGADMLRRAIGKKDRAEMTRQKVIFVDGAMAKGATKEVATRLFGLIEKFADYGFNKSHAAAYSLISYHTGYLKAHHPACFFAALMSFAADAKQVEVFRRDMPDFGVELLLPDANASDTLFKPERLPDGSLGVRFGMQGITGVTTLVWDKVVERRASGPFLDLADFDKRTGGILNTAQIDNMSAVGAFDALNAHPNANRRQTAEILKFLSKNTRRDNGMSDMFGPSTVTIRQDVLDTPEWSDLRQRVVSAVGFHIKDHPLDKDRDILESLGVRNKEYYEGKIKRKESIEKEQGYLHGLVSDVRLERNVRGYFVKMKLVEKDCEYYVSIFSDNARGGRSAAARPSATPQERLRMLEAAQKSGSPVVVKVLPSPSAQGDRVFLNCFDPMKATDFLAQQGPPTTYLVYLDHARDPSSLTNGIVREVGTRVEGMLAAGRSMDSCYAALSQVLVPLAETDIDRIETYLRRCPVPVGEKPDELAFNLSMPIKGVSPCLEYRIRDVLKFPYKIDKDALAFITEFGAVTNVKEMSPAEAHAFWKEQGIR